MGRENFEQPTNPYHYALHCLGGRWKMTILHEIYTYGFIRFNRTLNRIRIICHHCDNNQSQPCSRSTNIKTLKPRFI